MERGIFYQKLVAALEDAGFHLQAGDFSQDGVATDRDRTLASIRTAAKLFVPLHPVFNHDTIQRQLDTMRKWATMVCYRYALGQPVITAVIEADRLAEADMIGFARHLDEAVVAMLQVTAFIMDSIKIGRFHLGGVRLGSIGIILFVFFDAAQAALFARHAQKRCKIEHFFKKTWVLPWVMDVANKSVATHRGLPFLMSAVLDSERLQRQIFQ